MKGLKLIITIISIVLIILLTIISFMIVTPNIFKNSYKSSSIKLNALLSNPYKYLNQNVTFKNSNKNKYNPQRDIIKPYNIPKNTLIRNNYLYSITDTGMIGEYISPLEVKYENRNRQRKDCDREPNKRRWKNLRLEEICGIQSESRCLGKSSENKQIIEIDQGKLSLPKVWRPDKVAIKPPKEIKATENKSFHVETIVDFSLIPYDFNNLTNKLSTETTFNHSFGDYEYCDDDVIIKNPIQNPTEKHPVSIAEFLGKHLDLTPIRKIFASQYGTIDYHYRFPLDAMIKSSMVCRIRCMRSFQKLVNRFETNQHDAHAIGFENNVNGRFQIPDRRTFRHWENVRMDNNTLEIAMDLCVRSLRKELEKKGVVLGRRIGIDSTPLEALFNDKDAKYSGHLKKLVIRFMGLMILI